MNVVILRSLFYYLPEQFLNEFIRSFPSWIQIFEGGMLGVVWRAGVDAVTIARGQQLCEIELQ